MVCDIKVGKFEISLIYIISSMVSNAMVELQRDVILPQIEIGRNCFSYVDFQSRDSSEYIFQPMYLHEYK